MHCCRLGRPSPFLEIFTYCMPGKYGRAVRYKIQRAYPLNWNISGIAGRLINGIGYWFARQRLFQLAIKTPSLIEEGAPAVGYAQATSLGLKTKYDLHNALLPGKFSRKVIFGLRFEILDLCIINSPRTIKPNWRHPSRNRVQRTSRNRPSNCPVVYLFSRSISSVQGLIPHEYCIVWLSQWSWSQRMI